MEFEKFVHYFFFGIYPYISLTIFILGSIFRFNKDQANWKSDTSQLLHKGMLKWGSNLFHIGIIMLFFGHLVGFFTPIEVFHAIGLDMGTKQMLAIVLGGIAGLTCLVGLIILLIRRAFVARVRKTSKKMDFGILIMLLIVLSIGLTSIITSLQHRDGEMIKTFMHYVQGVFTFQGGTADMIWDTPFVYRIHMIMAFTLFLIFPFTRLVHIWSGVASIFGYAFRKRQIVRKQKSN